MREGALPSPAEPGARHARPVHRAASGRTSASTSSRRSTSRGSASRRARSAAIGDCSTIAPRRQKFTWGAPVSNHPHWPWQAAGGVAVRGAGVRARAACRAPSALAQVRRGTRSRISARRVDWRDCGQCAVAGVLVGWTIENVPLESLGSRRLDCARSHSRRWRCWRRSRALRRWRRKPSRAGFAQVIGPRDGRVRDPLARALGLLLIALTVLAVQSALGLAFDPRYRDFPFAPLTAAAVPFAAASFAWRRGQPARAPLAETVAAARAGAVRDLHRLERDHRQLAGAVVLRGAGLAGGHSGSGAGRARLRISSATASADSAAL